MERAVRISKFLSLVLRHRPEEIGIELDAEGWTSVAGLLRAFQARGLGLTLAELQEVVRTNDKGRFSFSPDGQYIRANQGHSVEVRLVYEQSIPPGVLFHGTAGKFLPPIMRQGLVKGRRHHVHLADNEETARSVGGRYGRPVVLRIASGRMHADGHAFYRSANGVWLVEHVPARYIEFSDSITR